MGTVAMHLTEGAPAGRGKDPEAWFTDHRRKVGLARRTWASLLICKSLFFLGFHLSLTKIKSGI